MKERILKKIDILLLIFLPVIAVVASLGLKVSFLATIALFFGLPSLWLSYRTPQRVLKTLIFSSIFSIPAGIIVDYIATNDGAWYVVNSVLRIFGIVPIEDIIFGFFLVYNVVIFYEHFLDKGKQELVDKKMKYFIIPMIVLFILFLLFYALNSGILKVKYAYFALGMMLLLLPSIAFLSFFPRLISKYIKTGCYFFMLAFLFEITALQLGLWNFPGQNFVGWIVLMGNKIPFEEFFFWFVMFAIAVLSYFEFFDDKLKRK